MNFFQSVIVIRFYLFNTFETNFGTIVFKDRRCSSTCIRIDGRFTSNLGISRCHWRKTDASFRSQPLLLSWVTCRCNCKVLDIFIVSAATLTKRTLFVIVVWCSRFYGEKKKKKEKQERRVGTGTFKNSKWEWLRGNISIYTRWLRPFHRPRC